MTPLPALFLAHGNPMNALEHNAFTHDWLQLLGTTPRPRAILVISAHWCTRGTFITGNARPPTIHDFRGFPPALFAIDYPCPGDPTLAREIAGSLPVPVGVADDWGLDHGAWSLLVHLYPQADIPVLQLSLALDQPAAYHFQLGTALRVLREQGVLIIGSGNIVHNIRKWLTDPHGDPGWAIAFDDYVTQAIQNHDWQAVMDYQRGPFAHEAVPTIEHYLPLLYVLGTCAPQESITTSRFARVDIGSASMRSVRVG